MDVIRRALSLLGKYVKLPLAPNAHYEQHEFRQLMAEIACMNWFAEGVSNQHQAVLPQADDLFYHLKKLNPVQVQYQFDAAVKAGVLKAKRMNLLTKPVWLAVDFNEQEYYGKATSHTRGGKRKNGTNKFFAYATASIVQPGRRFVIAALPYAPLDSPAEILERLLEKCLALVKIKCLLLDRGFFSSPILSLLASKNLKYVTPVIRNKKIAKVFETAKRFPCTVHYELNGFPVKLVFIKDEEEVLGFCTNLTRWYGKLTDYYGKRWGIETGYRVVGNFEMKTCSKNFAVRLFFYYFSLLFYNCWVLANAYGVGEKHFLTLDLKFAVLKGAFCLREAPPPLF